MVKIFGYIVQILLKIFEVGVVLIGAKQVKYRIKSKVKYSHKPKNLKLVGAIILKNCTKYIKTKLSCACR